MDSVDGAGTSSAISFEYRAQNVITAWTNYIWWHMLASLYQWGRAQRKAHVFEMLLQRYCYWENFKLAVYLRFVGLRAYVLPFVVLYILFDLDWWNRQRRTGRASRSCERASEHRRKLLARVE